MEFRFIAYALACVISLMRLAGHKDLMFTHLAHSLVVGPILGAAIFATAHRLKREAIRWWIVTGILIAVELFAAFVL